MAMMKKVFSFTKVDVSENKNFLHFIDLFAQERNILRGKEKIYGLLVYSTFLFGNLVSHVMS